ncbi:MAG: Uracil-DNA glycosylase, family 4 [Burkholderiaceae bacterium]|nr:MAG: Uracil-DNA glycosylase, family 4 [Burkholderiaceae bacterium]
MLAEMGIRVWLPDSEQKPAKAKVRSELSAIEIIASGATASDASTPPRARQAPAAPPVPQARAAPDAAQHRDAASRESPVARAARIGALDWSALQAEVAGCRACRLCESRQSTVFGVGPPGAVPGLAPQVDWMVIGEAPGENEDRQGEPFVGQAGKLLDNMLRAIALDRHESVFIANVIKCRPPGNRNPQPDEIAQCEPFLRRQIDLVAPKIILAMGRFAVQALLQTTEPIGRLRGRVHRYHGVPLIVTYHPAYLLRSLPDKAKAWADLCLARETLK